MDLSPTEEQRLIADSFAGALARSDENDWGALETLGLTLATWPEERGGAGATLADMVPALIETGRAASPAPVIACAILPGLVMSRFGGAFPELPEGPICAVADTLGLRLNDDRLSGTLPAVPGAENVAHFLMPLPNDQLGLFGKGQATTTAYELLDGRGAAELQTVGLERMHLGPASDGMGDWLRDVAATAFAADALGAMLAIRLMTLDYLKQRKQFGRPLASFQSLQHAMVDIHHETEHFHSLVLLASKACDRTDTKFRTRAVSALKRFLGNRIRPAAASAIQLHGGIGMTEDYNLGRYVKRVLVSDILMGSSDFHAGRLARLIADETHARSATDKESAA